MKATHRTIFIVFAAVFFLAFLIIYSGGGMRYDKEAVTPSEVTSFPDDYLTFLNEVEPEDSDWEFYRNERLGFSMKIPRQVEIGGQDVAHSPVAVFDDGKSSFVYVSPLYREKEHTTRNSFVSLRDNQAAIPSWIVYLADVLDDEELVNFAREHLGPSCVIADKKPSAAEGIFDITVLPSSEELDDECFVKYIYRIKYSPKKQRAALWAIGQAFSFVDIIRETHSRKTFDFEMADSFQFE